MRKAITKLVIMAMALTMTIGTLAMLTGCNNGDNPVEQGIFLTLQEAYESELVTSGDIKHIVYFMNGVVHSNLEQGAIIDFTPQITKPTIADLDVTLVAAMKTAFMEFHQNIFECELENGWITAECIISSISLVSFLGEFNSAFAVRMTSSLWEYGAGNFHVSLGGLEWSQFAPVILIFTHNQTEQKHFS